MKVLLIGSGGREHAIAWALAKSPHISEIFCCPGNGGTISESKCRNISLAEITSHSPPLSAASTIDGFVQAAQNISPDFVIIGPEEPLCAGLADLLWEKGIPVVGPKSAAAELEGSKDKAKQFMQKYGIACPASQTFTSAIDARRYAEKHGTPIVIKADGLAAGKGVVVAENLQQAYSAIDDFMITGSLGAAGKTLVIEEYLAGTEISVLAAVSLTPKIAQEGQGTIIPFISARDHKRLMDGSKGPNTGGMGAIAPVPDISPAQMSAIQKNIIDPTLAGLIAEGFDYRGFLFFGIMLSSTGPKLLEYNVRLGDPETQAVLPLMKSDFAQLCLALIDKKQEGSLKNFSLLWKKGFVCAPVLVSGGYPSTYDRGLPIRINETLWKDHRQSTGINIFIAGANKSAAGIRVSEKSKPPEDALVTSGGRVLCVSASGKSLFDARKKAYAALQNIYFEKMFYRRDIGLSDASVLSNL